MHSISSDPAAGLNGLKVIMIPYCRINWMFEPSLEEYISANKESFFIISWSNGLQIEFENLSPDERKTKFADFKQHQILGM